MRSIHPSGLTAAVVVAAVALAPLAGKAAHADGIPPPRPSAAPSKNPAAAAPAKKPAAVAAPATPSAPATPAAPQIPAAAPSTPEPPAVTVLNTHDVQGILGREVLSTANENMGRIVDVLVDRSGEVHAAVIDFGGFLGVGSRKIAVDWGALHFPPPAKPEERIALDLTRDQVKAAPEYQDGKPVVVLGALGKLETLPSE